MMQTLDSLSFFSFGRRNKSDSAANSSFSLLVRSFLLRYGVFFFSSPRYSVIILRLSSSDSY